MSGSNASCGDNSERFAHIADTAPTSLDFSTRVDILILYYSRTGATRLLAEAIAQGIDQVDGAHARLRTVPPVAPIVEMASAVVPPDGAPYVELVDLKEATAELKTVPESLYREAEVFFG